MHRNTTQDYKPVSLRVAKVLAAACYDRDTQWVWDRHNPQFREGGKPTDPPLAWKLSPPRSRHYDFDGDLRAPSNRQAFWYLLKLAVDVLRGRA